MNQFSHITFELFILSVIICGVSSAQNINTPEYFPDPQFRTAVENFLDVDSRKVIYLFSIVVT